MSDYTWYRRAHKSIAQGSLTNSKRVETFIKGVTPTHCTHGEGPYLFGVDGKRYIDFCCANGTSLFGYGHPLIKKAIEDQLDKGWLYSLGSTMEVECAELVKDRVPFVRKVRFLKTGSEACSAAIKIARGHTGRSRILSSGYHGWHDEFVHLSPPAVGVPECNHIERLDSFDQIREDIAAVIVEPIVTDHSPARLEWLQELVRKCRANGTLVIFDEVITGFRWPGLTFSRDSGIHPDIICLGKAMGSGLPLSCVGMGEHIGDQETRKGHGGTYITCPGEWFVSSTAAGELLSLAVFKQTCHMLHNKYKLSELWKDGQYFLDEFNAIYPERLVIEGYPTRGVFKGDALTKALFFQESHKAGILFGASWFYGFQHLGLRPQVINTCKDILTRIKTKQVRLEGKPPASPFAEKVRAS